MWRCFFTRFCSGAKGWIFSTYVEVFPTHCRSNCKHGNFLHVCGGVSPVKYKSSLRNKFSPRMWRCFCRYQRYLYSWYIFSTYVEVFPSLNYEKHDREHFLHVCGGVSAQIGSIFDYMGFSPRMWRCFQGNLCSRYGWGIFSTYVEVFPSCLAQLNDFVDFLHVCGGVSDVWLDLYAS